jgi:hypothetical protein
MHAVFLEVNATDAHTEPGREILPQYAAPMAREMRATAGYWLAPGGGRGIAVMVFDTEDAAKKAAGMFTVGQPPMPNAPEGVTVKTVEVREVLASI